MSKVTDKMPKKSGTSPSRKQSVSKKKTRQTGSTARKERSVVRPDPTWTLRRLVTQLKGTDGSTIWVSMPIYGDEEEDNE